MENRFASVLAFLISFCIPFVLKAQNDQLIITGPTIICEGDCFNLTAVYSGIGTPSNVIYNWFDSGGDIISGTNTQTITACGPGTYVVQVITANGGVTATASQTVIALPYQPVNILSTNLNGCADSLDFCEKVCPNTTVTYYLAGDSSQPGGPNMPPGQWSVSGSSNFTIAPDGRSVTVTWENPGSGSIAVVVSSSAGCIGEASKCVTIVPEPVAAFNATGAAAPTTDTIEICRGQTLWFNNTSQYAAAFAWSFSDNNSQTGAVNTQHTFNTEGVFEVNLVAFNACFCSDTTRQIVRVLDADAPTLECLGTVCPGATMTYTTGTDCGSYTWQVSPNGTVLDGGTATADSITVQWTAGPAGLIALGTTACTGSTCPLETTFQIPVIDNNAEIRGPEQVCPSEETVYSIDAFGGTGFTWTLSGGGSIQEGQGTNSVRIAWGPFPNPVAIYWLVVNYDNCYLGCGGRDSIPVRIVSPFVVNGPVERCEGSSGAFTSKLTFNGANLLCNWTLVSPNGATVWTSPAPTANPTVPFAAGPGFYRLLAVPDNPTLTCTVQAEWNVSVVASPPSPAAIDGTGFMCPFVAFSYEIPGAPAGVNVQWLVENGPGAPVADEGNPISVVYGNAGPYSVRAWFETADALKCVSDTVGLTVQALTSTALTGDATACEDAPGNYAATALPPGVDVQWSVTPPTAGAVIGGQGTAAAEIFWYEPGNHTVELTVCGLTATQPVTVTPTPNPMVQYPAGLCTGQTATVQTGTPFSSYSWLDAGGGVLSTNPTIDLNPGTYSVAVTDANGCEGAADFSIAQNTAPNVSITTPDPTGFCNNSLFVNLIALTNADGNLTYAWFQDGMPLGATGSSYSTNQYGNYTVQVTNAAGCTATAGPILLFPYCGGGGGGSGFPGGGGDCPPGTASIVATPTVQCDSFVFSVTGPLYATGSASWRFGISGGTLLGTGSGDNVGFLFPNAGYYLALAVVQLTDGSSCELIDSVTVDAVAAFASEPACVGTAVPFTDESTFPPGGGISAWSWDFGDPGSGANNTSTVRNPTHTFAAGGAYAVTLTVTANSGCTSTAVETQTILSADTAFFAVPAARCEGEALVFTGSLTPGMVRIDWNFGDPGSGSANTSAGDTVFHTFTAPGTYTVSTTATMTNGCTAVYSLPVPVSANTLAGAISPAGPVALCEGQSVTLTAPAGGVAYLWSDSTTTATTLMVTEEGFYTVTLTDANGCRFAPPPVNVAVTPGPDAVIKALEYNDLGQIIGVTYPSLSVCEGENVFLLAEGAGGGYAYNWSTGTVGSTLEFSDIRNNLLTQGSYVYTVTVTESATGCTFVATPFTVDVNPVPSGITIDGSGFCAGDVNTLNFTGTVVPTWNYLWSNGATGTSMQTEEAGVYTLTVQNEFGCTATSNAFTVLPGPFVSAVPGGCHTRCSPDTLCLPNIPNITAWQWYYNGNPVPGATSADFIATQSGTYWAELTDIYGCTNQSDPLDLQLFTGFGNVVGQVWVDVNDNGLIDGADTLISGIAVLLKQGFTTVGNATSNASGAYAFTNIQANSYAVQIDATALPAQWDIVIGQAFALLSGCGTEVPTGLLIKPFTCQDVNVTVQLSACAGDSVLYNGTYIPAGGSQVFPLTTYLGCDSTVTVSVAPLAPSAAALAVSICDNETYNYNGNTLLPGQTASFVYQNVQGCDSTVTITVTPLPTYALVVDLSACEGTQVEYNGTFIAAGSSVDLNYVTVDGCDSIVQVAVLSLPLGPDTDIAAAVCPGETYDYQGNLLPPGTVQQFTYANALGCDSVVTVTVTALPTSATLLEPSLCPGDVYIHLGDTLLPGQSAQYTYTNAVGCDSVLTINTIALPAPATALNPGVCPGETFVYQGVTLAPGDVQDFTFTSWLGCDSTVTVSVTELVVPGSTVEAGACPGTTYTYNGVAIPAGSSQTFTLSSFQGCDSLVTVNVAAYTTGYDTLDVDVCTGETYTIHGVTIPGGGSQTILLQTWQGCDSFLTVYVGIYPSVQFAVDVTPSCSNTDNGIIAVTGASGGLTPYRYSLDGSVFQDDSLFTSLQPGSYTVYLEDSHACVYELPAVIAVREPLSVFLADGVLPCDSSGVVMLPELAGDLRGLTFLWSDGSTGPSYTATDAGQVFVEVSNVCETQSDAAQVYWSELENNGSLVYVPNVFAPLSNDFDNSRFKPYLASGITLFEYQFSVFDRWGNLMFRSDNPESWWDGVFRGEDMNPGVYVYILKLKIGICGRVMDLSKEGDVTIVK